VIGYGYGRSKLCRGRMFPDQFFFMTTFSVRNGIARSSESLCDSCYWAYIQKGFAESEELVLCAFLRPARPVPFELPAIEATVCGPGSSLPPRLFVVRTSGNGQDFTGVGAGGKLRALDFSIHLAEFTDRSLMKAVNRVPANLVLLFEDIDCMKSGKTRALSSLSMRDDGARSRDEKENISDRNGVTPSGLLNVLDGFNAPTDICS